MFSLIFDTNQIKIWLKISLKNSWEDLINKMLHYVLIIIMWCGIDFYLRREKN